jgi:hypothetical protein
MELHWPALGVSSLATRLPSLASIARVPCERGEGRRATAEDEEATRVSSGIEERGDAEEWRMALYRRRRIDASAMACLGNRCSAVIVLTIPMRLHDVRRSRSFPSACKTSTTCHLLRHSKTVILTKQDDDPADAAAPHLT